LLAEPFDPTAAQAEFDKKNINPVWAWKYPQMGEYLPRFAHMVRNPFWIFVFRDHMASALTEVRLNVVANAIEGLQIKCHHEQVFMKFITAQHEAKVPIFLISYERARQHKGEFIMNLIKFLGVQPSVETIAKAIDFIQDEGPLQPGAK